MPSIPRRAWSFAALAVTLAALFSALGVWQVTRHGERRALNALRQAALDREPLKVNDAADATDADWRWISLEGTFDYDHEIVLRSRADLGAPGAHLVTPLLLDQGPAVLVLRGWLPAPDGVNVPLTRARAADRSRVVVHGLVQPGVRRRTLPPRTATIDGEDHLVLGALDLDDAAAGLPYPIAGFFVHADEVPLTPEGLPRPVPVPALDGGPHVMYAIQWFSFALISLIGALLYLRTRRKSGWPIEGS